MKKIISIIIGLLFIVSGCKQEFDKEITSMVWINAIGGDGMDSGYSIQQTVDGGYIVVGATNSFGTGNFDVYLIKTNSFGKEVWSKTIGGNDDDWGFAIQQTSDSGYIIVGSEERPGSSKILLIKTDSNGFEEWSRKYEKFSHGYAVQQTSDGGYIITGKYHHKQPSYVPVDIILLKTDSNGIVIWSKGLGSNGYDCGHSVKETVDGGYIIAGTISNSPKSSSICLIKTNIQGKEVWSKTFGGECGYDVEQTDDGGYIVVGAGDDFVNFIKTDSDGNEIWHKTYGGSSFQSGHSVQQTLDGGYIIVGSTASFGVLGTDVYIIKTDPDGNEIWYKTYGGLGSQIGREVQQTSDLGYVITGETLSRNRGENSDVYLLKIDPKGNLW